MISHDWHVQPSCQRPNRGPPERREFSPGGDTQVRLRLSSKPYKHTVRRKSRQRSHPTGFPDDFHMGNVGAKRESGGKKQTPRSARNDKPDAGWSCRSALKSAQQYGPPLAQRSDFGACQNGRQKIEKRTCFGGPCFEGTLRSDALKIRFAWGLPICGSFALNAVAWPRRLRTPVLLNLRCRAATRVAEYYARLATLLSVHCL